MLAGLNPTGGLRTAQLDRQGNLLVAHSALSMGADAAGPGCNLPRVFKLCLCSCNANTLRS